MKNKALNLRSSERRLNKLRLYSSQNDKTMTHDNRRFYRFAMSVKNGDSSSTHRGSQSYGLNRLWVNSSSPKNSSHRLPKGRREASFCFSSKYDVAKDLLLGRCAVNQRDCLAISPFPLSETLIVHHFWLI